MTTNERLPVGTVIADYKRQIEELTIQLRDARTSISSKMIVIESKQREINHLAINNLDLMAKIARMEKELIGAKRVIELAYDHRFLLPGMLQALNNYEDALR